MQNAKQANPKVSAIICFEEGGEGGSWAFFLRKNFFSASCNFFQFFLYVSFT